MKYLSLILLGSVFLTPCFAQEKVRLKIKVGLELQTGFIPDKNFKEFAVISNIHPGYFVSDYEEGGKVDIVKGFEAIVIAKNIKEHQGMISGELNNGQHLKGRIIRFRNPSGASITSWAEFGRMGMESELTGNLSQLQNGEIEVYQIESPKSHFQAEEWEALARKGMLSAGPGNGGGGSQYDMRFYFMDSQESLAVEKAVQLAKEFGASEGTVVTVSPFVFNWNSSGVLDAVVEMQRAYKDEAAVSVWGKTSENLDEKPWQKLFEYSGLGEVVVEENKAFSAYQGLDEGYNSIGVIVTVPEGSFMEKAGVAYKGYGEIGEKHIFLKNMDGMSDFSVDFFSGSTGFYQ